MTQPILAKWKDNLVIHSFNKIQMKLSPNKEWKKELVGQRIGWQLLKKTSIYNKDTAFGCLTGPPSGIIVLDFDDISMWQEWIKLYPILDNVPRVATRKGFHLYFKWNDKYSELPSKITNPNGGGNIDIQKNGKQVLYPPTKYTYIDDTIIKYVWDKAENQDLIEIPDDLYDRLNKDNIKTKPVNHNCFYDYGDEVENWSDEESQVGGHKRIYSKEMLDDIIKGLPANAYACGNDNYAFNMICALKKAKATRKQVRDLMMKAGTDFNKDWFSATWKQDTSKYAYDVEFVLSKSTWKEPMGCLIDIDSLTEPKKENENCHDIIWGLFFEWSENNNLVRIKNTEIVLKMKTEYYGEEISKSAQETLNLFICSSDYVSSLFDGKSLKGKRENISCFLKENQPKEAFPFVEYNWKYFGFLNGLFNIETGDFVTKDFPKEVLCRNYFDEDYNPLTEIPDCLNTIYNDQDFTKDTINIHLGLLGRSFYPINHLEDWGVVVVNYGVSNTGKSTTIEMVNKSLNQLKTKTIGSQSNEKSRFALDGKNNNELLIINEAENLPNAIGADLFKSMCRGEKVEIEGKGKDCISENWTTPMLLASNTEIPYKDKSGGIGNRIVYFKHSVIINPDPKIKIELHSLIPRLVPYLCKKYLDIATEPLELTPQICAWKEEVSENDDEFKAWINSLNDDVYKQLKFAKGKTIKPKDLQDAFDNHIKYTLRQSKTIRIGLNEQALLGLKGIEKHATNYCKSCEKKWEKGCCDKYSQTNKVKKIVFSNCELIDGGLNKTTMF